MELRQEKLKEQNQTPSGILANRPNMALAKTKQLLELSSGMEMNYGDGKWRKDVNDKWYQMLMQPQFKGKSTMDLVLSGDRTRTTRSAREVEALLNIYGFTKIEDIIGMVVPVTEKNTETGQTRRAYVRITKISKFTQEYQDQTWQQEGWQKFVTDQNLNKGWYGVEFTLVSPNETLNDEDVKRVTKDC
jgi:hypothetical protein